MSRKGTPPKELHTNQDTINEWNEAIRSAEVSAMHDKNENESISSTYSDDIDMAYASTQAHGIVELYPKAIETVQVVEKAPAKADLKFYRPSELDDSSSDNDEDLSSSNSDSSMAGLDESDDSSSTEDDQSGPKSKGARVNWLKPTPLTLPAEPTLTIIGKPSEEENQDRDESTIAAQNKEDTDLLREMVELVTNKTNLICSKLKFDVDSSLSDHYNKLKLVKKTIKDNLELSIVRLEALPRTTATTKKIKVLKDLRDMTPRDNSYEMDRISKLEDKFCNEFEDGNTKLLIEVTMLMYKNVKEIANGAPSKLTKNLEPMVAAALASVLTISDLQKILEIKGIKTLEERGICDWLQKYVREMTGKTSITAVQQSDYPYIDISYVKTDSIKVRSSEYTTFAPLTLTQMRRLPNKAVNSSWLNDIIKYGDMVVLDTPNMVESMNLQRSSINKLCEVLDMYGITTLNITEGALNNIEAATYNILANDNEHDDMVGMLYASCRKAVIITNDTHKEFNASFVYCTTHKRLHMRRNENCQRIDNRPCQTYNLRMNELRYSSFTAITVTEEAIKLVVDYPPIRRRSTVKTNKGTETIKFGMNNTRLTRWSVDLLPGKMPCLMKSVSTGVSSMNYSVASVGFQQTHTSIVCMDKYAALAHILNTMTTDQLDHLVNQCSTSILEADNRLVLGSNKVKAVILDSSTDELTLRNNAGQSMSSIIYNCDKKIKAQVLATEPHKQDYTQMASNGSAQLLFVPALLNKDACILILKNKLLLTLISSELVNKIQTAALSLLTSDTTDIETESLPLTNDTTDKLYQVYEKRALNAMLRSSTMNKMELVTKTNVLSQLDCKTPIVNVLGNIDNADPTEILDFIVKKTNNSPNVPIIKRVLQGRMQRNDVTTAVSSYLMRQFDMADGNMANISIKSLNYSDLRLQINKLHITDWDTIVEDIKTTIKFDYKRVLSDAATILRNVLLTGQLIFLPPLLWAHKLPQFKIIGGADPLRIMITWTMPGVSCMSKIYISNDTRSSFIVNMISPMPTFLFSVVAQMHHNPYTIENEDNISLEDDLCDEAMVIFIDGYFADAQSTMSYFLAFSIPVRLCGLEPYYAFTKFMPSICDGVISGMVERENNIFECVDEDYQVFLGEWVTSVVQGEYCLPLKRRRDGLLIDTSIELHELIDSLLSTGSTYGKPAVEKILTYTRPLYKLEDIAHHASDCYGVVTPAKPSYKDFAQTMHDVSMARRSIHTKGCTKCKIADRQQTISRNILRIKQNVYADIRRVEGNANLIRSENEIIELNPTKRVYNDPIIDELPLSGVFSVVIIKSREIKKEDFVRNRPVLEILAKTRSLQVTRYKFTLNDKYTNFKELALLISDLTKTKTDVILLNDDRMPSLMKKYKINVDIALFNGRKIIIPDNMLFVLALRRFNIQIAEMTSQLHTDILQNAPTSTKDAAKRVTPKWFDYRVIAGAAVGLLVIALLCYFCWPYVYMFLTYPGKLVLSLFSTRTTVELTPTLMQTLTGGNPTVVTNVTSPMWAKATAYLVNTLWMTTIVSSGVYAKAAFKRTV
jgi:hypothetical protein